MKLPAGTTTISGHSGQSRKLVPGVIGDTVGAQAATRSASAKGINGIMPSSLLTGVSPTGFFARAPQATPTILAYSC